MKRILLTVVLLACLPARADWEALGENDESVHYVDWSTLKTMGDRRRVWGLIDMKRATARGVNSQRSLTEYDCKESRWRYLQLTAFSGQMASGSILFNSSESTPWDYVAPRTFGEKVLRTACAPQRSPPEPKSTVPGN